MKVSLITVGSYEVNCVVVSDANLNAWLIDPGADADLILEYLRGHKLVLKKIMLTHGHIDHISAVEAVAAAYPEADILIHAEDAAWCFSPINSFPPYVAVEDPPTKLAYYKDGDIISDGELKARVMGSPGHSPGGVCLYFEGNKLLVAGDTIFAGSVGRTDLPGGSSRILTESLGKLAVLPADTRIISGHGPTSTIGEELAHNPYMRQFSR